MDTKEILLQCFYNFADRKLSGANSIEGDILQNQQLTEEVIKIVPTKTILTKASATSFYNLLTFLLTTRAFLTAVSIILLSSKISSRTKIFIITSQHQ